MTVTTLAVGQVVYNTEEANKYTCVYFNKPTSLEFTRLWVFTKIEKLYKDPSNEPFLVYAAHNLIREGWCVLTKDISKLYPLFYDREGLTCSRHVHEVFSAYDMTLPPDDCVPRMRLRQKDSAYITLTPIYLAYEGIPYIIKFSLKSKQNVIINSSQMD